MIITMASKVSFAKVLSVLAKVLCIAVLVLQSVLLDYILIQKDDNASDAGRYIWIALDAIVVIFWIIAMIASFRFFQTPSQQKVPEEGYTAKQIFKFALRELPFAYVSWFLYSVVLIAKINRMFVTFAVKLTSQNESLISNTSLKIILSLAGVIFALLAYAHHNEAHNTKYKLLIEKLGTAASIDLLDAIMLLDILFVLVHGIEVTYPLDRAVRAFSSICILLPIFPLFALRVIVCSEEAMSKKAFPLVMMLNSGLYLLLVNIPLFAIRMFLWFHHDVDITTFLTKNVIAIFKGFLDIYRDLVEWRRDVAKDAPHDTTLQMEPVNV